MNFDDDIRRKIESVYQERLFLRKKIRENRNVKNDQKLEEEAKLRGLTAAHPKIRQRRLLKGHFAKIDCACWGKKSNNVLSVGQDQSLIIWDSFKAQKIRRERIALLYVTCCAWNAEENLVGYGGLDNLCSVLRLTEDDDALVVHQLKHDARVSGIEFLETGEILTASADCRVCLWSQETGVRIKEVSLHFLVYLFLCYCHSL